MNTQRCTRCAQRRAVRYCVALNGNICPRCCGIGRRRDIDCPEGCAYLQAARSDLEARFPQLADLEKFRELEPALLGAIEREILRVRNLRLPDLKDHEVGEAIRNLLRTVEAEEKGVIYEYRSADLRIQAVAEAVKRVIRTRGSHEGNTRQPAAEDLLSSGIPAAWLKAGFQTILKVIRATVGLNAASVEYLDYLERYASNAEPGGLQDSDSRIVLPN